MTRRLLIEADGGSRGNPGPAGYGSVVRDARTGDVLAEVSDFLGRTTNNVAEYSGLIAGLRAAAGLAPGADAEVRMDSKLVVEQMSGRWKIKHPAMRPLAEQARQAASALGRVTYTWVPRARNAYADRLANEAMDAAGGARAGNGERPGNGAAAGDRAGAPYGGGSGEADAVGVGVAGTGAARAGETDGRVPAATSEASWLRGLGKPTTLLLLRHGETPWSAQRRYAGSSDIPLTRAGTHQAGAAARRLAARGAEPGGEISSIVASPMLRTRQTAAAVAETTGLPVTTDPAWAEVDFGVWEGLTHAEVAGRWPGELAAWDAGTAVAPPGGESFDAATRRVLAGLDALLAAHAGECVLVVSHVHPIKIVLLHALLAPAAATRHVYLAVASLCETAWYPNGTGLVRAVNDVGHLRSREPLARS